MVNYNDDIDQSGNLFLFENDGKEVSSQDLNLF